MFPGGFEIGPIRLSKTCQNLSGKSNVGPHMVIRRTSPFYCNLKLGLLKSRRDSYQCGTSHVDTDDDDVSLAGVLQDAVGRAVSVWCVFPVYLRYL